MEYAVVTIFILSSLFILVFSLGQLHLAWIYSRKRKLRATNDGFDVTTRNYVWPKVTVQLPVFNELYVVERLIDFTARLDYEPGQLEIQVLDDSTDETVEIISRKVEEYQKKGINIQHICRSNRVGYKAGALQSGLQTANGEFIAIFDADFMPSSNFLRQTIPAFADQKTGVVQTRWGHINEDYSWLTKLQAFGLDAHFSIEQAGRNHSGSFINFNGTAGVWRKSCIHDAGGWSSDTLTEDLDLSYRAQLLGWKFKYLENVVTMSELPVTIAAVKSQQFRWNKGAAETARKNFGKVLKAPISLTNKIHACLHLLNSSVYAALFLAVVLSIPLLILKNGREDIMLLVRLSSIFILAFISIGFFFWISSRERHPGNSVGYFISRFPFFLGACMGLLLHNSYAVITGFIGIKSSFIRTPKFKIENRTDSWKENVYNKSRIGLLTFLEGALSLYFLIGVVTGLLLEDYWLILFHAMLCVGFAFVFARSVAEVN